MAIKIRSRLRAYKTLLLSTCLGLALGLSVCVNETACAQAVERHLPTPPQGNSAPVATPEAVPDQQDDTPIGPALRALVILDKDSAIRVTARDGIDVSPVARLWRIQDQMTSDLTPYLGRKLSRKLIAEIETTIAKRHRALGYPFVALSTPEQEITTGVLQVRVLEYKLGDIRITHTGKGSAATIASQLSLKPGDYIDAKALSDDLSWINRYPYRNVQAVFGPGKAPGDTDLVLATGSVRPWQVYGGHDNSGSSETGHDRYYMGGSVGNLLGTDSVLSYQGTGTRNAVQGRKNPTYVSNALNYNILVGHHALLEAGLDQVETNLSSTNGFSIKGKIYEANLDIRLGVASWVDLPGQTDVRFGISAKQQENIIFFYGTSVNDLSMPDYAAYLGFHHLDQSQAYSHVVDLVIHSTPGNIGAHDTDVKAVLFSQGRQSKSGYTYVSLNYGRKQALAHGLMWTTQVISQLATEPLPRTEQAGLGGPSLVRGYSLDDGAYDSAAILKDDLLFPVLQNPGFTVRPYVFVDMGAGRDLATHQVKKLASVGVGGTLSVTRHISLTVTVADDLNKSATARAGATAGYVSLNLSY